MASNRWLLNRFCLAIEEGTDAAMLPGMAFLSQEKSNARSNSTKERDKGKVVAAKWVFRFAPDEHAERKRYVSRMIMAFTAQKCICHLFVNITRHYYHGYLIEEISNQRSTRVKKKAQCDQQSEVEVCTDTANKLEKNRQASIC